MEYKIIYGKYSGVEKKAVEFVSEIVSNYVSYAVTATEAEYVTDEELNDFNIILVGTPHSNCLIKKMSSKGIFKESDEKEGYSIKVMQSIYNPDAQMIIISGFDEKGAMYGAVDFGAYYIPYAENTHDHGRYFRELFSEEKMPDYERISAPSIKQRGLWTWGHVVYDYRKYIENMARLKMNTLIVWNDFLPLNISDVIDVAHSYGIKIYLGFSWGWDEARPAYEKNGKDFDISDESVIEQLKNGIVEKYKRDYSNLEIDGIYFQSFTETKREEINGTVIAECVVNLVNSTANELYKISPDLELQFGLHASSVKEKLEYIKKTDERIMIVWEDCGAFPYAYEPNRVDDFDETYQLTAEIAFLRGIKENFGVVTKGLVCLDWISFEHQKGPFVMGEHSREFIKKRTNEKEKLWKYVEAYWLENAEYAYEMVRHLDHVNDNTMITALVEDGMFEENIWLPVALFGEMMWDCNKSKEKLLREVALRKDIRS